MRLGIARLCADELGDSLHLGRVDKGALYARHVAALREEQVATADQLIGTGRVEDGARVNHRRYAEGYPHGEVGLDRTRDNVCRRALGGDNHVNTHGARLLCDAGDGHFDLAPGGHNQVAELVDNNNDVRHVFVSLVWTEATIDELFVVVLDVAHMSPREQFIAVVHLFAE